MANFATHLNTAAFVSGSVAILLNSKGICTKDQTYLLFSAGMVGGILPDIDHDSSKPVKMLQFFFANLIAFLAISKYIGKVPVLNVAGVWILSYAVVEVLFLFFKKLTTHRGIIHSVPAAFVAWFATTIVWYYYFHYSAFFSYLIGFFVFLGYMTHLVLDEIYSVDISGSRLKKSFGSALKLKGEKNPTYLIYSLLVILVLLLPQKEKLLILIKGILNV
ncbi:MAG: metal-dependent hydrolase [Epsilonproteobacteria bacterium]|nr:metal-dependent hydrolase [Campylobacterota bacterium]